MRGSRLTDTPVALAFETYLAFLALNKTYQTTRTRYAMGKRTSLMHLLVRDNIIYFFLYGALFSDISSSTDLA